MAHPAPARPQVEPEAPFQAMSPASGRLAQAYARLEAEVAALRTALDTTTAERDAAWRTVREQQLDDVLARHQRLAALGEMAATLAHQIRTPLSAALLYATNATRADLAPTRRDALLSRAVTSLHDLEQLVSDMLGFARGATASNAPVALKDLAAALTSAADALLRPGQELAVGPAPAGTVLCGSREALVGAVLNLVTNALQAAGPAARVSVSFASSGQHAELRVSDNGPGVPATLRERIFEPFFTSRPTGTGLGLAVVRSVAEAHGGQVSVVDDGRPGACFLLRLPLAAGVGTLRREQAA